MVKLKCLLALNVASHVVRFSEFLQVFQFEPVFFLKLVEFEYPLLLSLLLLHLVFYHSRQDSLPVHQWLSFLFVLQILSLSILLNQLYDVGKAGNLGLSLRQFECYLLEFSLASFGIQITDDGLEGGDGGTDSGIGIPRTHTLVLALMSGVKLGIAIVWHSRWKIRLIWTGRQLTNKMNFGSQPYNRMENFIKEKVLGKGSFATVYLVRRKTDQQLYALKQVQLSKAEFNDRNRALNEVRILASIRHPNIVRFKESFFDSDNTILNVVTEYAERGDLSRKIQTYQKRTNMRIP